MMFDWNRHSCLLWAVIGLGLSFVGLDSIPVAAQQPAAQEATPEIPVIPEEPKTVDPATIVPAALAQRMSAELKGAALRDVVAWLEEDCGIEVLIDSSDLKSSGVLLTDPVGEDLVNTPVYLMLNRLRIIHLDWYYADGILHLTSMEKAEELSVMIPYNIGDLLDAGFESTAIVDCIQETIDPDTWEIAGGEGVLNVIGDVVFVRQNDKIHRRIQGLMQALRSHARQTFIYDPPVHVGIRETMNATLSVEFVETPLGTAVDELRQLTGIDIRLDLPALKEEGVRERTPITLALKEVPLKVVLQAMLYDSQLTWILRDGVVWITSRSEADEFRKTVVCDVRDLCRDENESVALQDAISTQSPSVWNGTMFSPKPGVLVMYNTEEALGEVADLLAAYRTALKGSKPRKVEGQDPEEVITVYYKLQADVAAGLEKVLPVLVRPTSWKSDDNPEGVGEIILTPANSDVEAVSISAVSGKSGEVVEQDLSRLVARAVLIVTQTRGCHKDIDAIIHRVENGDARAGSGGGLGGFGGGGFGGGFFNLESQRLP